MWGMLDSSGSYPEKPITIRVGYDADSVGDQVARGFAEAAKKHLPQPFVVVNRPGASGTIAISEALGAKSDGYTLGLGTVGTLMVQPHRTKLPYGGPDTYVPVAKLVSYPNVLMVRAGAPWTRAGEFLNYARANAGKLTVGVPGLATVAHLNVEQLKLLANVDLKVVYFDGPQQVMAAIRGQIDAAVAGPGPIMPHVKSGNAVALGVFDERRLPLARDVPTFMELGFDISLGTAQAIIAPRATPASIVRVLDDAIRKAVAEPSFVSLAEATQNTIDYKGPEAFAAELRRGFEMNGELFRTLGIKKE
jgi:tripartite-type tricarboxylate transporter receptor subunit TctC